ncbi:MAG TPA: hypothetical protein VEG39_02155 [Clostridia bacterium]|nr:hypothetical protein [Clostridia bacterium]
MLEKKYALMALLITALYTLMILNSVNYNFSEFKLSVKTIFGQELTMEEMKGSSIYKAYSLIEHDTGSEEINEFLNKKSKNILGSFESWDYPYGYVSIWYSGEEKTKVFVKTINFRAPYTAKLTLEELDSVFACSTPEEIFNILGEPAILGKTYDKNSNAAELSYEWGIQASLPEKFIEDTEKKYGVYIRQPMSYSSPLNLLKRTENKFRLRVSVNADNTITGFSLEEYKRQRLR